MMEAVAFFHALSDATRLRCLSLVHERGELCVCELTRALQIAQPKISRHLALLRATGLVEVRREGVWMHYRLAADLPTWVSEVLAITLKQHAQSEEGMLDRQVLACPQTSCLL